MNQFLRGFEINATTWFYLSCLLIVAVYFKFTRFWALRNLDLVALLCMTPGWLLIEYADTAADRTEAVAYATTGCVWLLAGGGWWLLRMLFDPLLRRRPLLEPNMSPAGLTVVGVAVLVTFIAQILVHPFTGADLMTLEHGVTALSRTNDTVTSGSTSLVEDTTTGIEETPAESADSQQPVQRANLFGPGRPLLELLGVLPAGDSLALDSASSVIDGSEANGTASAIGNGSQPVDETAEAVQAAGDYQFTARTVLILGHVAIVVGLVLVALCHFGKLATGVGIAVLYLLLPYTAYHMARLDQVVLGALLVWAVASYRRPTITGAILAVASCAFYFPVLLLPLWTAFYWKHGLRRFWTALGTTMVLLLVAAAIMGKWPAIGAHFEWVAEELAGQVWRIPVFVTYLIICGSLALGPQPKTLGTVIAHSAVVLLGMQFWYMPFGAGYVLWHLPLVLLVIFRPNLKGRAMIARGAINGEIVAGDAKMAAA